MKQVEASRRSGEMGFFELPYDSDGLGHAQELADRLEGRFENLVIIGIGGVRVGRPDAARCTAGTLVERAVE